MPYLKLLVSLFITVIQSKLIDFVYLLYLQEVERLRQEKLEIDQQLKSLSGPQSGSYFPPPRERR